VFTGKVGVRVTQNDGTVVDDPKPIAVRFEVRPSILITELQPTTATCAKPALRLIGGMAYKMKATTLGFKATSIEYALRTPTIAQNSQGELVFDTDESGAPRYKTKQLAHAMVGNTDAVMGQDAFMLPPVPVDVPDYGAVMAVVARDEQGRAVSSTFGMVASNPLGLYYDGRYELAQIYPAKPVSSCIPGGQQGRNVSYSEAQIETRQRTLSVTLSKTFLKSEENNWSTSDGKTVTKSVTNTDGWSKTRSTANSFSFERNGSVTNGVSFTWSDGETVGGEAKVGFKPFGLGAEASVRGEKRWDRSRTTIRAPSITPRRRRTRRP
jgi:hypothetical protein